MSCLRSSVQSHLSSCKPRPDLSEDGPVVDPTIILDLIEGKLRPEEKKIAIGLVGTYRTWNQAWWQMQADLACDFELELELEDPEIVDSEADESIDAFDRYLAMELEELMSQPEFDLVTTRTRSSALDPYFEAFSRIVVENLRWRQWREKLMSMAPKALAELLANEIEKSRLGIPYPKEIVAAVLLKIGLDEVAALYE